MFEDIVYPGQFAEGLVMAPEATNEFDQLVRNWRAFQSRLFRNLTNMFPAYGTYFEGCYSVTSRMGNESFVHVNFFDPSPYSIEIGLSIPRDMRETYALVQTAYDFSAAGVGSPIPEDYPLARRHLLKGISGELSNLIGRMALGTTFLTEGGVDYLGNRANPSLSNTFEVVNVYGHIDSCPGLIYTQVGYRSI